MPQLCLHRWKGKQGKQYCFTIVSIQKGISVSLASQTKLQMSTFCLYTPRMVSLFWNDNRILLSYFGMKKTQFLLLRKNYCSVLQKQLYFQTHDDSKLSFCLDSHFWADSFQQHIVFQKGGSLQTPDSNGSMLINPQTELWDFAKEISELGRAWVDLKISMHATSLKCWADNVRLM